MLTNLSIKNLAIINNMQIKFCSGLNVITGETGSGKSVMLKALSFIVGARCTKNMVRFGEKFATIEAVFENLSSEIFESINLTKTNSKKNIISIKRVIYNDGKSTASINDSIINISDLKKIGQKLINFNEQGSNQKILIAENSLSLLDSFAKIENLILEYRTNFIELSNVLKKLKQIEINLNLRNEKFEELKSKIDEIEKANIKPNEDLEIRKKLKIVKNSAEIFEILNSTYELFNGNYENDGILNKINESIKQFEKISVFNDKFKEIYKKFKNLIFELEETIFEIEELKNNINFEPGQLEIMENRLSEIVKLKRKFGPNIEEIENKLKEMKLEIKKLKDYEDQKQKLIKLKNKKIILLKQQLNEISNKRKYAATEFSNLILEELKFLEMKNSKFIVELKKHNANINGLEDVDFLISANLGEPLKPLAKVASGGELSRITIAIVSVISEKFKTPTLIFDEIDSGVSGIAAKKIGIKLKQLSKKTQIICITHLAQIASVADEHFKIFKIVDENNKTNSKIKNLNFNEKVKEIARLINGDENNILTLKLANKMIEQNKNS